MNKRNSNSRSVSKQTNHYIQLCGLITQTRSHKTNGGVYLHFPRSHFSLVVACHHLSPVREFHARESIRTWLFRYLRKQHVDI